MSYGHHLSRSAEVTFPNGATIRLRHAIGEQRLADVLRDQLPKIIKRASLYGTLEHNVEVRIHATRRSFRQAVPMAALDWVTAWATFNTMDLQVPVRRNEKQKQDDIVTTATHEFVHIILFQALGKADTWQRNRVPFWFMEGMGVSLAHDDVGHVEHPQVAAFLHRHGGVRVLRPERQLLEHHAAAVYSAARYCFELLVKKIKAEGIRTICAKMRAGASFEDAFLSATGGSLARFEQDFVRNFSSVL